MDISSAKTIHAEKWFCIVWFCGSLSELDDQLGLVFLVSLTSSTRGKWSMHSFFLATSSTCFNWTHGGHIRVHKKWSEILLILVLPLWVPRRCFVAVLHGNMCYGIGSEILSYQAFHILDNTSPNNSLDSLTCSFLCSARKSLHTARRLKKMGNEKLVSAQGDAVLQVLV